MIDEDILRFDHEWREGDRVLAKQIACDYIERHRADLAPIFEKYTLHDLVKEVDALRAAGRHGDRIVVDMWLMATYPPQHIDGSIAIGGEQVMVAAAEAILRGEE